MSHAPHHGAVKRRMLPYKTAIADAVSHGMITSRREMEIVLAKVAIAVDQHKLTHGTTAFERRTGAIPRTFRDLVTSVTAPDITLADYTTEDRSAIKALMHYVFERCEWRLVCNEAETRHGLFSKLKKMAHKNSTEFHLIPGDRVSYKGHPCMDSDRSQRPT